MTREEWLVARQTAHASDDLSILDVFADWCEETSQPDAALYRWLADKHRWPLCIYNGNIYAWESDAGAPDRPWKLPIMLFICLPCNSPLTGHPTVLAKGRYRSLEEAEAAVAVAQRVLAAWSAGEEVDAEVAATLDRYVAAEAEAKRIVRAALSLTQETSNEEEAN